MNILETAEEYYAKSPLPQIQDKRRKLHTKELLLIIETAPFLSAGEKNQMSRLISLYPTNVIKNIKRSLIQQGLIFLRSNPYQQENIQDWLNKVGTNP